MKNWVIRNDNLFFVNKKKGKSIVKTRNRNIKKQVWLNREEAIMLSKKSKKVGMNEATYIRNLLMNYEPREKPDDRFYETMKQMRLIGNNLNQIARKVNSLGYIEESYYKKESEKWNEFMIKVKKVYLNNDY
ncbi:MAG: plasmid mobilization relaxosome protein MobC [Bacteroidales bacterium]|nr:plasmid mobilization relaxosome protein MobC [Bacteroidales bacterium]